MPDQKTETKKEETKAEKFVRLANARLGGALDAIAKLEGLNSPNYESTPEQRAKVIEHLVNAVNKVEAKFKAPASKEEKTARSFL